MNDPDQDLRDLFARQREAEHALVPAFRSLQRRATHEPSARAYAWRWALACGAATAVALLFMIQPAQTAPSLTQALPVFLPPAEAASTWLAGLSSSATDTPSDFLLPHHLQLTVL